MRWYVTLDGTTTDIRGEHLAKEIRDGKVTREAFIRDEHSSVWVPILESPFARCFPGHQKQQKPEATQGDLGRAVELCAWLLLTSDGLLGLLLWRLW